MAFKFNFSTGGDSDSDDDTPMTAAPAAAAPTAAPPTTPAQHHTLASLHTPPNISYTTLHPTPHIRLPRRELYDVRMQLMSEDPLSTTTTTTAPTALIGTSDIHTSVYEGGLKSWECSLDLVQHLFSTPPTPPPTRVLELGCGTALPSLHLFQAALASGTPCCFTLADYNVDVLRLVTLPNLLLAWCMLRAGAAWEDEGDLEVTRDLVDEFVAALEGCGVGVEFGLVLGSETIYSLATLGVFTDVLLGAVEEGGRGLVAAKRMYFGVGGGVGEFLEVVEARGGWVARMVREEREVGVGRCVVEVVRK
ncbi:uncharacterized protein LAJ45_10864 [Morchella importuna]|uniref:uncharacterized protein n=1 Tax=Morchella importuna TaxID=1174673 RepID=UPI001E8DBC44|nr:uncharacterized protein LAJ45_10864 [Morchella importuna]KAH8145084.1 hypothetical protein LAJ45_10864 [Morchella importuna]